MSKVKYQCTSSTLFSRWTVQAFGRASGMPDIGMYINGSAWVNVVMYLVLTVGSCLLVLS
jgi:hypothetical protein